MIPLEEALKGAPCPKCGIARVRPVDVRRGSELSVECRNPRCGWWGLAHLPEICRTKIYLDTSTVSNIAKSGARSAEDEWSRLHEVLRRGYRAGVLCCPGSSIVQREVELAPLRREILQVSRSLGDPGLRHEVEVVRWQLARAIEDYVDGRTGPRDVGEIERDCFPRSPHEWAPYIGLQVEIPPREDFIAQFREGKAALRTVHEEIFQDYENRKLSFDEIRELEARADGETRTAEGLRAIAMRAGLLSGKLEGDLPDITDLDVLVHGLVVKRKMPFRDALAKVVEVLRSDAMLGLPLVDVSSRLFAALAVDCRGETGRKLRASDAIDIQHISTYAPYMDIMIVDRYFADVSRRKGVDLPERCGCDFVALTGDSVDEFIDRIEGMIAASKVAGVAETVYDAIGEGGHHEEFAETARCFLAARGVEVPSPEDGGNDG